MNIAHYTSRSVLLVLIGITISTLLGGCGSSSPQIPQLRIMNDGAMPIENFTILFPEDEISFGNIPANSTSEYLEVPNGVYRYAAYRYTVDGVSFNQPVEDWVGETPLVGSNFTYTINFNVNRSRWEMVKLIDVSIDD